MLLFVGGKRLGYLYLLVVLARGIVVVRLSGITSTERLVPSQVLLIFFLLSNALLLLARQGSFLSRTTIS